MVLRGLAVGKVGEKKRRKAVGPSDGKMNGVWEAIAMAARRAVVINPFRNMKAAQTTRSGKRASNRAVGKSRTGPATTFGSARF